MYGKRSLPDVKGQLSDIASNAAYMKKFSGECYENSLFTVMIIPERSIK
ncbi:MAG: hypothetical protein IKI37_00785 [Oscillospiraceae bacterium]|nr:hypothetical protein [Oscillospiraceae bacterium]